MKSNAQNQGQLDFLGPDVPHQKVAPSEAGCVSDVPYQDKIKDFSRARQERNRLNLIAQLKKLGF